MCEVRKYSDMTEIPRKKAKDHTLEKCSGRENISNLEKVLLWYLLSYYGHRSYCSAFKGGSFSPRHCAFKLYSCQ